VKSSSVLSLDIVFVRFHLTDLMPPGHLPSRGWAYCSVRARRQYLDLQPAVEWVTPIATAIRNRREFTARTFTENRGLITLAGMVLG
jgi:hypothetical protein